MKVTKPAISDRRSTLEKVGFKPTPSVGQTVNASVTPHPQRLNNGLV